MNENQYDSDMASIEGSFSVDDHQLLSKETDAEHVEDGRKARSNAKVHSKWTRLFQLPKKRRRQYHRPYLAPSEMMMYRFAPPCKPYERLHGTFLEHLSDSLDQRLLVLALKKAIGADNL